MTKIFILGPYSTYNFGDYVMLLSFLHIIQKVRPDAKIYVFSSAFRLAKEIILKDNILKISVRNIVIIRNKIKFLLFLFLFSKMLIIGGGSLIVKKRNPLKYIIPIIFLKLTKRNVYFISIDGSSRKILFKLSLTNFH